MKKGNLVLTRHVGQSISITTNKNISPMTPIGEVLDEILITPVRIRGGQIKIIINADRNLSVMRTELIDGQQ